MAVFYIPPPGIRFRLIGCESKDAIFSRAREPQVGTDTAAIEKCSDQYFTLVAGIGKRQGSYLIKGIVTGKHLYCRDFREPFVWHTPDGTSTDQDSYYDINWFKIEPGTGIHANNFRLHTPCNDLVIYSRSTKPYLGFGHHGYNYADHFFSFDYEDMEFVDIVYNTKAGKVIPSPPYELQNFLIDARGSDQPQDSSSREYSEEVTNTSNFEESAGSTISAGITISGNVPGFAELAVTMDAAATRESKWGESTSFAKTWKTTYHAKAQPGKALRVIVTIERGALEVPYTLRQKSKSTGQTVETTGIWKGVSSGDTKIVYKDVT